MRGSQAVPAGFRAPPTHPRSRGRSKDIGNHPLEHGFGGRRVNTRMTPNVLSLTADMVANFTTVVVPSPGWAWEHTKIYHHLTLDEIEEYRAGFRLEPCRHGEGRCLDHIETDALGNWLIHFFPLNDEVVSILEIAASKLPEVACGTGEAASFDPKECVASRLDRLEKEGRLRARDPWWFDESVAAGSQPNV
jgi:hypothetical protein